jgi:hypothetical protein
MAITREIAVNNMIGTVEDADRGRCTGQSCRRRCEARPRRVSHPARGGNRFGVVKRALDQEVHEREMRLD